MGKQLVPSQRQSQIGAAASNLPAPILSGIADLLTAFAAGPHQDDGDRKRVLRIYGEAVSEFPAAVSEYALRWLKLHNPRNPFRPTPQDVYEACDATLTTWRERVVTHFTSIDSKHACWGWDDYRSWNKGAAKCGSAWGAAPFEHDCLIPDVLVRQILSDHFSRYAQKTNMLAGLGRERLARIPPECFLPGQLEAALDHVVADEKRREEKAKHEAYLSTLGPDLRRHRAHALGGIDVDIPEADLLERARKSLEAEQEERARRNEEAKEESKRLRANNHPDVQAAIAAMQSANDDDWDQAVDAYIALLEREGAKAPAHLIDPTLRKSSRGWRRYGGGGLIR